MKTVRTKLDLTKDFHQLTGSEVEVVLQMANAAKYRAPKNTNGSRARYFFAKLQREHNRIRK